MATVFKLRSGKYVDANNNEVKAPKAAKQEEGGFPEGFDAKIQGALEGAGYATLEEARAVSDDVLKEIDGIGAASIKAIRGD